MIISVVSFRNSFYKVTSYMCIATASLCICYFVIALISIYHKVETIRCILQKFFCICSGSCRSIVKCNNGRQSIITRSYEPYVRFTLCPAFRFLQNLNGCLISH